MLSILIVHVYINNSQGMSFKYRLKENRLTTQSHQSITKLLKTESRFK